MAKYTENICPNQACDGKDEFYFLDDCTKYKCDKCGTTWQSYGPLNGEPAPINIKIKDNNSHG